VLVLWLVYGQDFMTVVNNPSPLNTLTVSLVVGAVMFGLVYWYVLRRRGQIGDLGYRWPKPQFSYWQVLYSVLLYFGLLIVVRGLILLLIPQVDLNQEQITGFESVASNLDLLVGFITLVVITPVVEETLFRGFIFQGLKKSFGLVPAAIASAALFALAHGQLNVALDTFILGLFLAYLFDKSNSIWPSIILHATKNAIAFSVLFLVS